MAELTWTDLQQYVNDKGSASQEFLTQCLTTAVDLVTAYVGDRVVPVSVLRSATLEVGSKVYERRNSGAGDPYGDPSGGTRLAAKDPLVTAYPLLNRYLVAGI